MGVTTSQGRFTFINGQWVQISELEIKYKPEKSLIPRVFPDPYPVNKNGLPIINQLIELYGSKLTDVLSTERTTTRYVKIRATPILSDFLKSKGTFQEKYDGSTLTVTTNKDKISITHQGRPLTFDCPIFGPAVVAWAVRFIEYPHLFDNNEIITCEVLCRQKQNKLKYASVPPDFSIIIDLSYKDRKTYGSQIVMENRAKQFGYMAARAVYVSDGSNNSKAKAEIVDLQNQVYLGKYPSELGGSMVEGLVWKDEDGSKRKFVRKDFREEIEIAEDEDTNYILSIGTKFNEKPRWGKGLQRLRQRYSVDSFTLRDMPKLLPSLKQELDEDLIEERKNDILALLSADPKEQEHLWLQYKNSILKASRQGLEDWLRAELLNKIKI